MSPISAKRNHGLYSVQSRRNDHFLKSAYSSEWGLDGNTAFRAELVQHGILNVKFENIKPHASDAIRRLLEGEFDALVLPVCLLEKTAAKQFLMTDASMLIRSFCPGNAAQEGLASPIAHRQSKVTACCSIMRKPFEKGAEQLLDRQFSQRRALRHSERLPQTHCHVVHQLLRRLQVIL